MERLNKREKTLLIRRGKKWKFKMEIQNLLHGIQLSEYVNGSFSLQNSSGKNRRANCIGNLSHFLLKNFSSGLAALYDALSVSPLVCWSVDPHVGRGPTIQVKKNKNTSVRGEGNL